MNDIALTLPKIRGNAKQLKEKIEEHKKRKLQDDPNEFEDQMNKVVEIKIYLKSNFHKTDIDDNFLGNLDELYATQYLEKMGKICSKFNIQKILKIKPIDKCDFQLSVDQVRNKPVKVLHVFPNNKILNPDKEKAQLLSDADVEDIVNKTAAILRETNEDKLSQIKKREIKKDEIYLFQPEIVENILNKAKDDINDKLLYLQASGTVEQQMKNFDLSIETIRRKYMNPNKSNILNTKDNMTGRAKFQNIDKVAKRDILTDKSYEFPFLNIHLTKEILNEINKPIDVPIEIIVKDINYIIDNFPIEHLVQFDDENINSNSNNDKNGLNKSLSLETKKKRKSLSPKRKDAKSKAKGNNKRFFSKERNLKMSTKLMINKLNGIKTDIAADDNNEPTEKKGTFINNFLSENPNFMKNLIDRNYKKKDKFFKIKSVNRMEVLNVYKKMQMPCIYRIIGLLINLLYWIIFGYINRIQVDKYTKQQILFKIYEELNNLETHITDKKIYDKLFMPILILIVRIECEAIFTKKFKNLFENKTNLEISMEKINEIITHIFDPNCYFNTFTIMANDMNKLKHQLDKSLNPNYKTKANATSNLLNQLFTTFTNEKNVKIFRSKFDEKAKRFNQEDLEDQKKYILESKVEFYNVLLNRVNNNLKKRNMDPIFNISKNNEN